MIPPLPPRVLAWVAVVLVMGATAVMRWDEVAFPDVIYLRMH